MEGGRMESLESIIHTQCVGESDHLYFT